MPKHERRTNQFRSDGGYTKRSAFLINAHHASWSEHSRPCNPKLQRPALRSTCTEDASGDPLGSATPGSA